MEFTTLVRRFFQKNPNVIPILAFALALRYSFWQESIHTPLADSYKLFNTDMNFFSAWADEIPKSDILFNKSFHPLHDWHIKVVKDVLTDASDTEIKALWNKWYGEKTFHQAPAYPYFIAFIRRAFGEDPSIIYSIQLAAGLLGLLFLMLVSIRLLGGTAAAVAGVLYCLCGPVMYYESVLSRESMLSASYCVFLYSILNVINKQSIAKLAFLGVMTSVLILLRESNTLLASVLIICLWFHFKHHDQRVRILGVVLVGIVSPLLPVLMRNFIVGVPILSFSSVGPITFLASNHSETPIGYGWYIPANLFEIMFKTEGKGIAVVLETLRTYDNLLLLTKKVFLRAIEFWTPEEIPNNLSYRMTKEYILSLNIAGIDFRVLNAFALAGLFVGLRTLKKLWPLYLVFGVTFLSCLGTYNLSRFRAPVLPVLILFSAYFIVTFLDWAKDKKFRSCTIASAFVALIWCINLQVKPQEFGYQCPGHLGLMAASYTSQFPSDPHYAISKLEQALQLEESCLQQTDGIQKRELLGQFIQMHAVLANSLRAFGDAPGAMKHDGRIATLKSLHLSDPP